MRRAVPATAPAPAAEPSARVPLYVTVVVTLSFLLLNTATLLNPVAGPGEAAAPRSPLYTLWLAAPALLWVLGAATLVRRRPSTYWGVCLVWGLVLLVHACVTAMLESYTSGVASFMAWGVWFGGFLWLALGRVRPEWPRFLLVLFVLAGVLNALPVLYEWVSGSALLRVARLGDIVRRYGVSQSISVLGVQLGAGIMASLYFGASARSTRGRLLAHVLALVQWAALLLVVSRGPLIFSVAALGIVAWAERRSSSRFIAHHAALVGLGATTAVAWLFLAGPGALQLADFVVQAFSSEDVSNQVRSQRWLDGIAAVAGDLAALLVGLGAGSSVAIPNLRGTEGITHESSLVKLLYETGLLGVGLMAALVWPPLRRAFGLLRRRVRAAGASQAVRHTMAPILGVMLLVLMETAIHDMMMAWVIAFYFWMGLGTLWQVVRASALAPAPAAPAPETPPNPVPPRRGTLAPRRAGA
jgi:hypothetical protein